MPITREAAATATITLDALGNGAKRQGDAIAMGDFDWIEFRLKVTMGTGAGNANGFANLKLARQLNTEYTGGASGSDAPYAPANGEEKNLESLGSMHCDGSLTGDQPFSEWFVANQPSENVAPVVENECGGSFGTGCVLEYRRCKYSS